MEDQKRGGETGKSEIAGERPEGKEVFNDGKVRLADYDKGIFVLEDIRRPDPKAMSRGLGAEDIAAGLSAIRKEGWDAGVDDVRTFEHTQLSVVISADIQRLHSGRQ